MDDCQFVRKQLPGAAGFDEFHIINPRPFKSEPAAFPATLLFCSRPYLVGYLEESWLGESEENVWDRSIAVSNALNVRIVKVGADGTLQSDVEHQVHTFRLLKSK